jgi:hypothetical protein
MREAPKQVICNATNGLPKASTWCAETMFPVGFLFVMSWAILYLLICRRIVRLAGEQFPLGAHAA